MRRLVLLAGLLSLLLGCREDAPRGRRIASEGISLLPEQPIVLAEGARALEASFGKLRLLGVKAEPRARPGETIPITLYFQVEEVLLPSDRADLLVFVHGQAPFAELNQTQADHALVGGRSLDEVRRGDVLVDRFALPVPLGFPADELLVFVGLYQGQRRWPVREASAHDGHHRVEVARVGIEGGPPALPTVEVPKRRAAIAIDGVLDEEDWQRAPRIGPFVAYDGRSRIENATYARLLWDESSLYVAFECDDKDIHTPYEKRDDPLYESEVVELFIDGSGQQDVYVELQAAPNGVLFDAAFRGGRRKNFETRYDVAFEVKQTLRGTLNDPSDVDEGWISEWRVPVAELRGVEAPLRPGAMWRANLFRLDRVRDGSGKIVRHEASAWSSPLSRDFHNLARFGTFVFRE